MVSGSDFHFRFQLDQVDFDVRLNQQGTDQGYSVEVKPASARVTAENKEQATRIKAALERQLSASSSQVSGDFITRSLSGMGARLIEDRGFLESAGATAAAAARTDMVASSRIAGVQGVAAAPAAPRELGRWMTTLAERQRLVANKYWEIYIQPADSRKDHSMLKEFLKGASSNPAEIEQQFIIALRDRNAQLFSTLFKQLSPEQLFKIDRGEQLNILLFAKFHGRPVEITAAVLRDIQDYIRDSYFSGVVAISDGKSTHTLSSNNIADKQVPFAIHSVGKVFTGALALRLIEEGIISEEALRLPIQLDAAVLNALPPKVRAQVAQTSLHDLMLHQGKLGDYLDKYLAAIDKALKTGEPVPRIERPEDFLRYADEELVEPDASRPPYSNLGLLLVGLSIQHLYNSRNDVKLSYQEILNRYILQPAGLNTFETEMPENSRVNRTDPVAPHISGGPAGGYWTTANDLLKFGQWLGTKCQDAQFMRLTQSYGGEFYNEREIAHGGSIESSSAYLSNRLDNGLTIAIVSDMNGASLLFDTIHHNLLT